MDGTLTLDVNADTDKNTDTEYDTATDKGTDTEDAAATDGGTDVDDDAATEGDARIEGYKARVKLSNQLVRRDSTEKSFFSRLRQKLPEPALWHIWRDDGELTTANNGM